MPFWSHSRHLVYFIFLVPLVHLMAIPDKTHPGFDFATPNFRFEGDIFEPYVMGMKFLPNGKLLVGTSSDLRNGGQPPFDPNEFPDYSQLFIITNPSANNPTLKKIANRFIGLSGVTLVGDSIFISDRDGFYYLEDTDGDEIIDNKVKIVNWPGGPYRHQWAFTPMYLNGKFYTPWSGTVRLSGVPYEGANNPLDGAFLEFDLEGNLEAYASGFRSPNGSGIGPGGEMYVTDNQGEWLPACTIAHIKKGKNYGFRHVPATDIDEWDYDPPTAWLPYTSDTTIYKQNTSRSTTEPNYVPFGTFKGHWLFGDVNREGLMRMSVEEVKGIPQGAVFHFTRGIRKSRARSAVNRLVWGPDGTLYIGSVGSIAGNWPHFSTSYPIYTLKEKSDGPVFEILSAHSKSGGLELIFTTPVDVSQQNNWDFEAVQWTYTRMAGYGAGKQDNEILNVASTQISNDGRRVFLSIPGIKDGTDSPEGYVLYVQTRGINSSEGENPWNNEVWYTMHNQSEAEFNPEDTPIAVAGDLEMEKTGRVFKRNNKMWVEINSPRPYSILIRSLSGKSIARIAGKGPGYKMLPLENGIKGVFLISVQLENISRTTKVAVY